MDQTSPPDSEERVIPPSETSNDALLTLRALLTMPAPKDEHWQEQAAKAVSILAVELLNEPDDLRAFRSVALLALAQSLGVKEAKKRTLKLTRWIHSPPPSLTSLTHEDEQEAALSAVSKLKENWVTTYAYQALSEPAISQSMTGDLLKWARGCHSSPIQFVRDFYAPLISNAWNADRATALLRDVGKLIRPATYTAPHALTEPLGDLLTALQEASSKWDSPEKGLSVACLHLLSFLQDTACVSPSVLLRPQFPQIVQRLLELGILGAGSKQALLIVDSLIGATLSLIDADIERHGVHDSTSWVAMIPHWRAAYPGWDEKLKQAAGVSKSFIALVDPVRQQTAQAEERYRLEAAFARLIPAWHSHLAELPSSIDTESIAILLKQAAACAGIETMGERDECIQFDPLTHSSIDGQAQPTQRVKVVRPGLRVQRPDGSVRMLVSVLVKAI